MFALRILFEVGDTDEQHFQLPVEYRHNVTQQLIKGPPSPNPRADRVINHVGNGGWLRTRASASQREDLWNIPALPEFVPTISCIGAGAL